MSLSAADPVHVYNGIAYRQSLSQRQSILSWLAYRAQQNGDDPYITFVPVEGETVTLSYRELDEFSNRLAAWVTGEFSIRSGDSVALIPTNDIRSVVAIYALLRTGCAILFLSPFDPLERLRLQSESRGVKGILFADETCAELSDSVRIPDLTSLPPVDSVRNTINPYGEALVFGTSGSTAVSKLVVQTHYNAAVNAIALKRHHGLKLGDQLLGCLPIHHVNGVHFTLFATLVCGAHAVLAHAFDPFGYSKLIEKFKPRIASVVPSILEAILATWREPTVPGNFEYFVSAAAPLTTGTARDVRRRFGCRILQGYGLTETTNFSTTMPADLPLETYQRWMEDEEIPSIGVELFGNEVSVLMPNGIAAPLGEVGEICIRGHNVMKCYFDNLDATTEAFRDGWFHSQDLGYALKDNESGRKFFFISGRCKNIAKVGGEGVSLDELDRALIALPYVQDAACVARPVPLLGDEISAAVVYRSQFDDAALLNDLAGKFPPAALPRRIIQLDKIPRTPTGKLRRNELLDHLQSLG